MNLNRKKLTLTKKTLFLYKKRVTYLNSTPTLDPTATTAMTISGVPPYQAG